MSNDEPKFMKPGDDPELDRALDELRFDSGLYEAGDYDMFGRRRALGRGRDEDDAALTHVHASTIAPAGARSAAPPRIKPTVALLAILAAVAPVAVYAAVWRPPRGYDPAPPSVTNAAGAPSATASACAALLPDPEPGAASTAEPLEPVAEPVTSAIAHPARSARPRPKPGGSRIDPRRNATGPNLSATAAPQATATPSAPLPAPPPPAPPPPPLPTFKPVF